MCFLFRALPVDLRGAVGITQERQERESGRVYGRNGLKDSDVIVGISLVYAHSRAWRILLLRNQSTSLWPARSVGNANVKCM